jgi:aspartate aminotransferase
MRSQSDEQRPDRRLSGRTLDLERSAIREMFDRAQQYDDDELVHMEIGEPDFDTPSHITDAAATAARNGGTHYTSNAGLPELREAIADDITRNHRYDPDTDVVVTAGAMEALALAFLTLVDPGDEVVVPTPAWPNYRTHTALVDGKYVEVPLDREEGFALDTERLTAAIDEETALVLLTTPSNPTGQVYDGDAIARIVAAAADHGAVVVADEVYKDLVYDGPASRVADATNRPEHVVTLGSCSKTYAMTGWRVGWLAAPEPIVDAAVKFHESLVACAPTVSQYAALAALTGDPSPVREMHEAFRVRRNLLVERVAALPRVSCPTPEGAFYAFLDVSAVGDDSTTVAKRLLDEYGVVVAPGVGFGSTVSDHLRVSFATDEASLDEGFDRIERFLDDEGIR